MIFRAAGRMLRLARPSHLGVLLGDFLGRNAPQADSREHLDETIAWICRAQDAAGGGGVSAGYSLLDGWLPPYPETTGYMIPTLYDYARLTGREELRGRARRMAEWEIEVQLDDGSVQAGVYRGRSSARRPAVFNTGQVILGWCRAYQETGEERFLEAARRAAAWLLGVQSPDGAWRVPAPETETDVHAYDARTGWSLLEAAALTGDSACREAGLRNLEWTLTQQRPSGWFASNTFFTSGKWNVPFTHTIAYVMEGLLEGWRLAGDARYLRAAQLAADKLLEQFERRGGFMPGDFGADWNSAARYTCLTGDAQIAGVWLRLYAHTRDARYLGAARRLNDVVKASQSLRSANPGIRGGVKGSQPVTGRYTPLVFINWGAKFLADSLLRELSHPA